MGNGRGFQGSQRTSFGCFPWERRAGNQEIDALVLAVPQFPE